MPKPPMRGTWAFRVNNPHLRIPYLYQKLTEIVDTSKSIYVNRAAALALAKSRGGTQRLGFATVESWYLLPSRSDRLPVAEPKDKQVAPSVLRPSRATEGTAREVLPRSDRQERTGRRAAAESLLKVGPSCCCIRLRLRLRLSQSLSLWLALGRSAWVSSTIANDSTQSLESFAPAPPTLLPVASGSQFPCSGSSCASQVLVSRAIEVWNWRRLFRGQEASFENSRRGFGVLVCVCSVASLHR